MKKSDEIMLRALRARIRQGARLDSHHSEIFRRLESIAASELREGLRLINKKGRKAPARKPKFPPKNRRMP